MAVLSVINTPSQKSARARAMAKARKVTITLADATAGTGHRFGVCSLASTSAAAWGGGSQLLSAGRDGTICAWKYSEDAAVAPELSLVLEDHTDWVNDLVLVHEGGQAAALVSCSSDTTLKVSPNPNPPLVSLTLTLARPPTPAPTPDPLTLTNPKPTPNPTLKVWRPSADAGHPAKVHTMRRHTDYVKALAYAPQAPLLASASCDRTVLLWDLRTLQPCGSSGAAGETHAHRDSVYCLATNPNASLLASGSVDSDVRLWDLTLTPTPTPTPSLAPTLTPTLAPALPLALSRYACGTLTLP